MKLKHLLWNEENCVRYRVLGHCNLCVPNEEEDGIECKAKPRYPVPCTLNNAETANAFDRIDGNGDYFDEAWGFVARMDGWHETKVISKTWRRNYI